MIKKLLYKLTSNLPCRLIKLDSGPYLERYYVGKLFNTTFYLHRFVSSDSERHVHNHPWTWGRALVLTGGYEQDEVCDLCPDLNTYGALTRVKKIRFYNKVNHNTFHRILSVKPDTWTLFFHGPRLQIDGQDKGWGFLEKKKLAEWPYTPMTVFTSHKSASDGWQNTAPKGRDAGRKAI